MFFLQGKVYHHVNEKKNHNFDLWMMDGERWTAVKEIAEEELEKIEALLGCKPIANEPGSLMFGFKRQILVYSIEFCVSS